MEIIFPKQTWKKSGEGGQESGKMKYYQFLLFENKTKQKHSFLAENSFSGKKNSKMSMFIAF